MVEMVKIDPLVGVQSEENGAAQWLSFLSNVGGQSS